MKHQRQAGFIRNYSYKQITYLEEEPSEFSYFRARPLNDERDEFSPYKMQHEEPKKVLGRPPLPIPQPKSKELKQQSLLKAQGQKIYTRLKQKINRNQEQKERSKQKLQTNISSVRQKIESIQNAIQQLKVSGQRNKKTQQYQSKFEADVSSSSLSSSSQSQLAVVASIPSPKKSIQKPKQLSNNYLKQVQNRESRQNTDHLRQNIITFNSRVSNHPPLQIKSYSSSSSEKSPENKVVSRGVNKKGQREQNVRQQDIERKDVYKNKGGICFEVDTKQFSQPVCLPRQSRNNVKKVGNVDKRAQMLRRREKAKAYDQQVRKALFTPYN